MKAYQLIVVCLSVFAFSASANIELKKLDFKKMKDKGIITVHFNGEMNDYPELSVIDKAIQVTIPNSKTPKNIEKAVSFSSALNDTQLRVYQTSKTASKIKALLPFSIKSKESQVALTIKDNRIELSFPRVAVKLAKAPKYGTILKKKNKKVKKEFLNKDYLNSLLKIDKTADLKKNKPSLNEADTKVKDADKVKVSMSSPFRSDKKKGSGSSISLLEYGGKFVAFLGFVLLLFYAVITLMKKGFIKKGKLGFLNNAEQISVINQTYIAPKKSLMLIKAHNQVFLVSNTDQGIHPISEIKDAAGLFKDGERAISGENFDTNLSLAGTDENNEVKVKIKEDITKSNKQSSLSNYLDVKEKVKFSDQLKKKVKNLKPLQ